MNQAQAQAPVPERVLVNVAIEDLHTDPGNPRAQLPDIDDLARSIEEIGLLQTLVARVDHGRVVLVAGHRRLAALRRRGWTRIPVEILRDIRPRDVLVAKLVENGQRCALDPVEEALAIQELIQSQDLTVDEVATRIGRAPSTVTARLALLDLDMSTQTRVRAGLLPIGQAVAAVRSTRRPASTTPARTWHFGDQHPLASQARQRCKSSAHNNPLVAGGVACGPCWEAEIRDDSAVQARDVA